MYSSSTTKSICNLVTAYVLRYSQIYLVLKFFYFLLWTTKDIDENGLNLEKRIKSLQIERLETLYLCSDFLLEFANNIKGLVFNDVWSIL